MSAREELAHKPGKPGQPYSPDGTKSVTPVTLGPVDLWGESLADFRKPKLVIRFASGGALINEAQESSSCRNPSR